LLNLREEHTPRVVERRVLRGVFGLEREEVTGELRKLHNEELKGRYCSTNIVRVIKSRRMRWAGHGLMGKPEEKRPLGRPRRRWKDNIKVDLQEVGCGGMDRIELPLDRNRWRIFESQIMNFRVP